MFAFVGLPADSIYQPLEVVVAQIGHLELAERNAKIGWITAEALRRMGLANAGAQDAAGEAFSTATFLANCNKTRPGVRRALFDRYGSGFSKDMDRIARVAERINEGGQAIANPSGSARQSPQFACCGGLGGALMTDQVGCTWLGPRRNRCEHAWAVDDQLQLGSLACKGN